MDDITFQFYTGMTAGIGLVWTLWHLTNKDRSDREAFLIRRIAHLDEVVEFKTRLIECLRRKSLPGDEWKDNYPLEEDDQ